MNKSKATDEDCNSDSEHLDQYQTRRRLKKK